MTPMFGAHLLRDAYRHFGDVLGDLANRAATFSEGVSPATTLFCGDR
jgi:hypothetical protein